jgi:hypothetical protein
MMKWLQLVWRGGKRTLLTAAGWLAVHGTALAQTPQPKAAEPESGSYVAYYAIVILAIALGLLFVCRPVRRRDRARSESYDEIKIKPKD